MAELFNPGQYKQFNYTGGVQSIELLPGKYIFECYGASGGGGSGASAHASYDAGGLGGYTKAVMEITEKMTVYCYVGGAGKYGVSGNPYGGPLGGWNGGGQGGNISSGSGGGSTDFRKTNGAWNNTNSLRSRFIVAGGGGGSDNSTGSYSDDGSGGSGGGLTAQGAWISGEYNSGYAGTQSSGGGFGYGADVTNNTDTGGAGGGWYGGKVTNHNNGGAGGGSSYIKGYSGCNTSYHSYQTNINYIEGGSLQIGKRNGNGYAKITVILVYDPYNLALTNANEQLQNLTKHNTESVTITLDSSANAKRFKEWEVRGVAVSDIDKKSTSFTFTMPPNDVVVKAILYPFYLLILINADGEEQQLQKYETEIVDISLSQYDAWNVFEYWYIKNVEIEDIYSQDITFKMPANDVYVEAVFGPNRLNTNIYKNIFPEDVFDYGRIMTLQETAPTTLQDITQENHGFIVGNIVSCVNGKYQKAIADNTEQGIPLGIVAAVHNENFHWHID